MKSELVSVRVTFLATAFLACHVVWAADVPAVSSEPAAPAAKWDARFYNPKPAAEKDDIELPMPCGGALVFRKVVVPEGGPLDDRPIQIGKDGDPDEIIEKKRQAFIAGSFIESSADKKSRSSYYLIAKYELNAKQYQALSTLRTDGAVKCEDPAQGDERLPVRGVSWAEVQYVGHLYNIWLRKNAKDSLPKKDNMPGFVRLPTEVEWEFAARGGIKVNEAEYVEARYPMPDGMITEYEFFRGGQGGNKDPQRIGVGKPNPLGLHDVLGNVSEMTQDAFRVNKLDRQYGVAGSYVVRGSNYQQPVEDLHAALRREGNPYDESGELQDKTVGFRWVFVAREMTTRERVKELKAAYSKLGQGEVSSDAAQKGASAVKDLNTVIGTVEDKKLKEQLKSLEDKIRASNQEQEEARNQAIRASLNLGAFLCTKLKDDGDDLNATRKHYKGFCEDGNTDESCERRKQLLEAKESRVEGVTQYYASSLVDAAELYGGENLAKQVPVLDKNFEENKKLNGLRPYLATYWAHQKSYLGNKKIDRPAWLNSCIAVK